MTAYRLNDCIIDYSEDKIVLRGDSACIHVQAQAILERFAYSTRPFRIKTETPELIVLIPRVYGPSH